MDTTSPTLLQRLRRGKQPEAWEHFVRLYSPLLAVWARKQGMQDADANDLVQEVLTKLWTVLPSYERREGHSFRSWLATVTANQCRDFRKRKATRPLPGAEGLSGVDDSVVVDLEEREYREAIVGRYLDIIRPDFETVTWKAFAGLVQEGRSAAEVGQELSMTPNAVYLARHRVLSRLKQELEGLLD